MPAINNSTETVANQASNRLLAEMKDIAGKPVEGCETFPRDDDILTWTVAIDGPAGSPYEGGTFFMILTFTQNYPFEPPRPCFLTRIHHCNIDRTGFVTVPILAPSQWRPCFGMRDILKGMRDLLHTTGEPTQGHGSYQTAANTQWRENRAAFEAKAREWTQRYAH